MTAYLIGLEFSVQFDHCDPTPGKVPPGIPEELVVADETVLSADILKETADHRRYYYAIVRLSAETDDQAEIGAQWKFSHMAGYVCRRSLAMVDPDPQAMLTPEILSRLKGSHLMAAETRPESTASPAPEAAAKPAWQIRFLIETTADPGALRTRLLEYVDQAIVQLQPARRLLVTVYFQADSGEEAKELAGQLLQQECEKLGADEPLYNEIEAVLVR
jgi:hypothetical protein